MGFALAAVLAVSVLGAAASARAQSLTVALYPKCTALRSVRFVNHHGLEGGGTERDTEFRSRDQWDGDHFMNPPASVDVFVFDAMCFDDFRVNRYLDAIAHGDVANAADFIAYARDGAKYQGNFYALPLLGCSNVLFCDETETALANATTFTAVTGALDQCTFTSQIPPDRCGLMLDMSGGTANAALYPEIAHALTGTYPLPLPPNEQSLDTNAGAEQRRLLATSSFYNATVSIAADYERAAWFSKGYGKATIGYTESMSQMSDTTLSTIAFKVMPFGDGSKPPLFYADVIGVNTTTQARGTRAMAVKLANVMASSDTMVASVGATSSKPRPQYLMVARTSVFRTRGQTFPLCKKMHALVTDNTLCCLRLMRMPAPGCRR